MSTNASINLMQIIGGVIGAVAALVTVGTVTWRMGENAAEQRLSNLGEVANCGSSDAILATTDVAHAPNEVLSQKPRWEFELGVNETHDVGDSLVGLRAIHEDRVSIRTPRLSGTIEPGKDWNMRNGCFIYLLSIEADKARFRAVCGTE